MVSNEVSLARTYSIVDTMIQCMLLYKAQKDEGTPLRCAVAVQIMQTSTFLRTTIFVRVHMDAHALTTRVGG